MLMEIKLSIVANNFIAGGPSCALVKWSRRIRWPTCLSLCLAAATSGCFRPEPIQPEQLSQGYILLLPGVESTASSMAGIIGGLRDAGIEQAIDLDQWGDRPFGTFRNLLPLERNRKRAAERAVKLTEYRRQFPEQPITIIGFSGGGGMALFIAEALPEEVMLEGIILLGPAISPDYDITPSLVHCRKLVNFYSEHDWFMAGVATEWFGTMDRKKTATAGSRGFLDMDGNQLQNEHCTQMPWIPAWRELGHDGGHSGWLARGWAREVLALHVAPVLPGNTENWTLLRGPNGWSSGME